MLTNYHTHTTWCDGANTPEEMVLGALEKGFDALGFSGHGHTAFDLRYCMKDVEGYRNEVLRLKEKYADRIRIYLGVEEDMWEPVDRRDYDYIIGSAHYICKDGKYYSVDSTVDRYQQCLDLFSGDPLKMAQAYYEGFCDYILRRNPDVVGHFDLITKYDARNGNVLLGDKEYLQMASGYLRSALKSQCVFEVNNGAIARGIRTMPYPCEELLYLMKKEDAKIMLASDCHSVNHLDCAFESTKALLRQIGFTHQYVILDGEMKRVAL